IVSAGGWSSGTSCASRVPRPPAGPFVDRRTRDVRGTTERSWPVRVAAVARHEHASPAMVVLAWWNGAQ
ncbi:hypothetical protein MO973_00560, partial [Paenibacillus sp. TRM 82003]|nr:hypothetical protein [Paenibacillus sp. TRM 82003]